MDTVHWTDRNCYPQVHSYDYLIDKISQLSIKVLTQSKRLYNWYQTYFPNQKKMKFCMVIRTPDSGVDKA